MLNHFLADIVPHNYLLVDGGVKLVDFEYSSFGCLISPIPLNGSIQGNLRFVGAKDMFFLTNTLTTDKIHLLFTLFFGVGHLCCSLTSLMKQHPWFICLLISTRSCQTSVSILVEECLQYRVQNERIVVQIQNRERIRYTIIVLEHRNERQNT